MTPPPDLASAAQGRPTLLVVPISSAETPLDQQVEAAVAGGADLVELRVDLIQDVEAIDALLCGPRRVPYILTIRSAAEGGAWTGDEAERIALYERLGLRLPGYVDVELATWERSANVRQKIGLICETTGADDRADHSTMRPRNRLILSWHDLKGTPGELQGLFDRLGATPAHVVKAAFTPRDATDAIRVLRALHHQASRRSTIGVAMGEAGLLTRVAAKKFGAFASFAALGRGAESAPGQPTLAELREIYRWPSIDAHTSLFGVVGWPVTHSLSPALHNAAMAAANVNGAYVPLPVAPSYEALAAFMDAVTDAPELGLAGFSVTLPHKEHALRWLREKGSTCTDLAAQCGAVNTLIRVAKGWHGENTDVAGVLAALETSRRLPAGDWQHLRAAVLGAGGVARGVVLALVSRGADVTVYGRSMRRAEALAADLRCAWAPWDARTSSGAQLVINCTPLGQHPHADASPLDAAHLQPQQIVFDTVYRPPETKLLRIARRRGCETIGGLPMFIGQAAAQFALWHGRNMPDVPFQDPSTFHG